MTAETPPLLTKADVLKFYKNWSPADKAVFDELLDAIGQPVEYYRPPSSPYTRVTEVGYAGGLCFAFLNLGFISISTRVQQEFPGTYPHETDPVWRLLDLSNRSAGRTRGAGGFDPLAVAAGEVRCEKCGLLTKRSVDANGHCEDCQ